MAGLGDLVQKAVFLGMGMASYAAEKAGTNLQELRAQAQKVADEMIARGEMNGAEARKYVDDLLRQAQQQSVTPPDNSTSNYQEPRRIEIVEDESDASTSEADILKNKVQELQEQLRKLKQDQ
jgi:polyhydroxyalkanoate synthesis regulator phasin